MARSRKRKPQGRRHTVPGWVWMAAGFALGLAVAFGVYVGQRAAPGAERARSASGPAPEPDTATPVTASPIAPRGQPAAEPEGGARFEFYELLPDFEVVVPEVESRADLGPAPADVAEPGRYVLQVGSFTEFDDADRMRANLALLGIESRLQRVSIDDQVFHRVRVGPISSLREINRIRNRLRDARIESMLMRAPEE